MFCKQLDQSAVGQSVGCQETRQYDYPFASLRSAQENQGTVGLEISFHRNFLGRVKKRPSVAEARVGVENAVVPGQVRRRLRPGSFRKVIRSNANREAELGNLANDKAAVIRHRVAN